MFEMKTTYTLRTPTPDKRVLLVVEVDDAGRVHIEDSSDWDVDVSSLAGMLHSLSEELMRNHTLAPLQNYGVGPAFALQGKPTGDPCPTH